MRHFDITQWVDYARGLTSAPERDAMAKHIADGCEACGRLLGLMRRVHTAATAEIEAPLPLVEAAKAIFPARRNESELPGWFSLPALVARLVLDGISLPVPEGIRGLPCSTRQAVYHADTYAIELQVEREPESNEVVVMGQVVDRAGSGKPLSEAAVLLIARNRVISASKTSHLGEFCFVSPIQPDLKVCMHLEEAGKRVVISLTRILAGHR